MVKNMGQTTVTFRMDSELKKEMESLCADLGFNMTTAFTMFAKTMVREQRLPFALERDRFYSPSNVRHIKKGIEELTNGQDIENSLVE